MLWMGLRCAEVADLRIEDINEREATIHVTGKGGAQRMLPIPPEFAGHLTRWLDYRRRTPGPLIVSTLGGPYTANSISDLVARWMRTSGVKVASRDGRSAHALRHTAASDISDGGAPLTAVQALLGHQHLSSTAIYLRRTRLEDLRTAMTGRDYQ
jgi:integrase